MKRLLNRLEEEGELERNPAERIKHPEAKRRAPKGSAREDFLAPLEATSEGTVTDLRDGAILLFLGDTCCRVGGLCGLTLADLLGHSNVIMTRQSYGVFTIEQLQQKHRKHSPIVQIFGREEDDNDHDQGL
ncbi:MAG: hypothetical protein PVF54_10760 [Anaerolineae bacterium]|jgi:site-specific recombinase XerC